MFQNRAVQSRRPPFSGCTVMERCIPRRAMWSRQVATCLALPLGEPGKGTAKRPKGTPLHNFPAANDDRKLPSVLANRATIYCCCCCCCCSCCGSTQTSQTNQLGPLQVLSWRKWNPPSYYFIEEMGVRTNSQGGGIVCRKWCEMVCVWDSSMVLSHRKSAFSLGQNSGCFCQYKIKLTPCFPHIYAFVYYK